MRTRRGMVLLGLLVVAGIFFFAFHRVFEGDFELGEMYPDHSSLRAGPRGAMILYETLEEMPGIDVTRWHERFEKWIEQPDVDPAKTTVLLLDVYPEDLYEPAFQNFLARGGRLVLSLRHRAYNEEEFRIVETDSEEEDDVTAEKQDDEEEDRVEIEVETEEVGITKHQRIAQMFWQLENQHNEVIVGSDFMLNREAHLGEGAPSRIEWRTPDFIKIQELEEDDASEVVWEGIYTSGRRSVIVGQQYGKGEMIVLANGLPLTNESMFRQPNHEFLIWLLGDRPVVVFDEYHFGIIEPKSIALLIRDYNLQYVILALAFSFVLFIWHGGMPLMGTLDEPLRESANRQTGIGGYRDLLRRYISDKNVLQVCLDEWHAVFMARKADKGRRSAQFAEAEALLQTELSKKDKDRNLSSIYKSITEILNKRRLKP